MWLMRRLMGKSGVEQVALLQQTDGDSYRALTYMMLNLYPCTVFGGGFCRS